MNEETYCDSYFLRSFRKLMICFTVCNDFFDIMSSSVSCLRRNIRWMSFRSAIYDGERYLKKVTRYKIVKSVIEKEFSKVLIKSFKFI